HDAFAAGLADEGVAVADEPAGGNFELEADVSVAVVVHADEARLATRESLDERPGGGVGRLDEELFVGFFEAIWTVSGDDFWPGDGELVAFAAHRFHEYGEMELTAAAD